MTTATKVQCAANVWRRGWPRPCSVKSTVERDGKTYCRYHDPDAVDARRTDRQKRWEAAEGVYRERLGRNTAAQAEKTRKADAYTELVTVLEALIEEVDRDQRSDGWSTPARDEARALIDRLKEGYGADAYNHMATP